MKMKWSICLAVLCANSTIIYAQTPSFQGLGDLPGLAFESYGMAISANGTTAVGYSRSNASPTGSDFGAFRWTQAEGMVDLGYLPGVTYNSRIAYGISGDGAVVVGIGTGAQNEPEAFRWSASTGLVGLGDLPGGNFYSKATDVSADGSVVVGSSDAERSGVYRAGQRAFRWTEATGMVDLGTAFGGHIDYSAQAVSADGSVIVGSAGVWRTGGTAFRWTQAGGMVNLGHIPDYEKSYVLDVSADGTTVVGYSRDLDTNTWQAFRWTQEDGMVGFGDLPGGEFLLYPYGISADGGIVVGDGFNKLGYGAVIWSEQDGIRNVKDLLTDQFGLDLTDWTLTHAYDVSADGRTVVGSGINPDGNTEAWVATVPEPATLSMLALGGLAMLRRRRK